MHIKVVTRNKVDSSGDIIRKMKSSASRAFDLNSPRYSWLNRRELHDLNYISLLYNSNAFRSLTAQMTLCVHSIKCHFQLPTRAKFSISIISHRFSSVRWTSAICVISRFQDAFDGFRCVPQVDFRLGLLPTLPLRREINAKRPTPAFGPHKHWSARSAKITKFPTRTAFSWRFFFLQIFGY